jgi:hypothetical protein
MKGRSHSRTRLFFAHNQIIGTYVHNVVYASSLLHISVQVTFSTLSNFQLCVDFLLGAITKKRLGG